MPELFIQQDPMPNAMTLGSDKPFIVITTGLVNLLDAEELRFVIGHELGHVLSGHAVYRTMLYHLTRLATRLAWFAIGYIGLRVIIAGLEEWYRKSELSCDRAGVLAGQDPAAARRALMKVAGGSRISELSQDAFQQQAREYDAVPDVREGLIKLLQMQGTTHPFAVIRFAELDRWVAEGDVPGHPGRQLPAPRGRQPDQDGRRVPGRGQVLPGVLEPVRGPVHRPGQGLRRPRRAPGKACSTASSGGAAVAAARAAATTKPGATWIAAPDRPGARSRARTRGPVARPGSGLTGPSAPGSRPRRS